MLQVTEGGLTLKKKFLLKRLKSHLIAEHKWIKKEKIVPKVVFTLEPTSPFRTEQTIQKCVELLAQPDVDSVVGVSEVFSVLGRIKNNKFEHIFPDQPRRRQDRECLFQESSTIYGTLIDVLKNKRSVLGDRVCPLVISNEEAFDLYYEEHRRVEDDKNSMSYDELLRKSGLKPPIKN